jgi:sensor domain CHASE-containing protein
MKVKLSHNDLLLLLGIVVAVVIAVTTWAYSDMTAKASLTKPQKKKTSLNLPVSSLIQKLMAKTASEAHSIAK